MPPISTEGFSTEHFSTLVGQIYDCALDPTRWPATLEGLCVAMQFRTSTLALLEMPSFRPLLDYSTGIPPSDLAEMLGLYQASLEAWGGAERIASFPLDEPQVFSHQWPDGIPHDNALVAWGLERGLVDTMAIAFSRGPDALSNVGFGRHVDDGAIGERELALARLFVPHLKRALVVSRLLDARAVERTTFAAVLDGLSIAVLLVGADLRLLHANRAGEAMLRTADPLGLRHGRVTAPNGLAAALGAALAATVDDIGRRGLGVPARRADGEELVLHVLPLVGANLVPGASAAIFVAPAVMPRAAPLAAIAALFDLTPTETRVLELIGSGRANAEVAAALGVAVSTVRSHLLRLFEKTGTHRQAELVSLLASFSLPVG